MKPKASDIFEGPNSSLRKTFEEAVRLDPPLKLNQDIRKAGYPYCYVKDNRQTHCATCVSLYKKLREATMSYMDVSCPHCGHIPAGEKHLCPPGIDKK
jgi:hypothetical protein